MKKTDPTIFKPVRLLTGARRAGTRLARPVRLLSGYAVPLARPVRLLILLTLLMGTAARAQNHTDKRSVSRRYPATLETTLEVRNKYGKIQVENWEKDSIAIQADIFLTESSASRLRKLKDDIRIDFNATGTYIIARTMIESERGRLARELKSIENILTGANKHVEINFRVQVPYYLDVVLQNKFGDIYMDDLGGRLDIDLSNGVLNASRIEGNSTISLSFANGMIRSLGSATMTLSYSDLTLGEANQLDLDSKSSILNLDSVNVVKINSRRDKFYFKQVEYLYGSSSFTQVWVYDFIRESDLYMKYGKLTIENIRPGFSRIYVESDYTDISLYLERENRISFDILHHENAVLRLPGEMLSVEESFDGRQHFRSVGTMGEGEPVSELSIAAIQKCYINISFK